MAPASKTEVHARLALLANGWARNVTLTIENGCFSSVRANTSPYDNAVAIAIPGLCNAHSHAFQRALAGYTEHRGHGKDTFWTWRNVMYALAGRIDAAALETIAAQLYAEMLMRGYTSVVEFHYLHRAADRETLNIETLNSESMNGEMHDALRRAASTTGMRLVYAPVLYERSGFESPTLTKAQAPFGLTLDDYFAHYETVRKQGPTILGAHSLRAVSPASLKALDARSKADRVPIHVHVAEQPKEVDECVAKHGARPVEWLLDHVDVDERWTLVHATHIDDAERARLAPTSAVACLCPSTEANLGDGFFPHRDYVDAGGRFAIGSDSHVSVDPFEELRWLEYGQRLLRGQRNVAAHATGHTGHDLFVAAQVGGAQSAGLRSRGIAAGSPADLVVLDRSHPSLVGHGPSTLLDALVFANHGSPIERVMVNGEWHVKDGSHRSAETLRDAYAQCVRALSLRDVL